MTQVASFRGSNFAVGSEDGYVHFFRYIQETKRYQYLRAWSCAELANTGIIGLAAHEEGKTEVTVAVVGKSQHVVYLKVWKQVYVKATMPSESILDDEDSNLAYETLSRGCHQSGITQMDISI